MSLRIPLSRSVLPLLAAAVLFAAAPAHADAKDDFCARNPQSCEAGKERREARKEYCEKNPGKCEALREERKDRRERTKEYCEKNPAECEQKKQEFRDRQDERRERRRDAVDGATQPK